MCRTVHALLSTAICAVQMVVRVFMTTTLMLENIIRMVLQTVFNFISFMLQLISLVPLCCVFLVTSRLKCFMCGGGGPCPVNRGGACDCLMSLFAIIILFFIFRATGVLDKIFYSIGYAKATTHIVRFIATTGSVTECSRNDTDTEYVFYPLDTTAPVLRYFYIDDDEVPTHRAIDDDETTEVIYTEETSDSVLSNESTELFYSEISTDESVSTGERTTKSTSKLRFSRRRYVRSTAGKELKKDENKITGIALPSKKNFTSRARKDLFSSTK